MKKFFFVFGTRPEAIKIAPLIKKLQQRPEFNIKICVTAQHRQMLDQVLNVFDIVPDFDLNLMKAKQDLYDITVNVLMGLRDIFREEAPDLVLVHGDTTTTMTASLAAFYQKIPVGHVEAGLRTGNLYSPWPEEANRTLTGQIAQYHFTPTKTSRENLLKENTPSEQIFITGNTVIDALLWVLNKIEKNPKLKHKICSSIESFGYPINNNLKNGEKKIILITGHRRENFGQGFLNICQGIKILAEKYPDFDFVYPVHLNPNVQEPVYRMLNNLPNIYLLKPLDYEPFVYMMKKSYLILTDSGGIQEEAPTIGKPILVMRNTTERPEAVDAGTVKLVGTDKDKIIQSVSELIDNKNAYNEMSFAYNPYGDGTACEQITQILLNHFS